jgi:chemosensory pili system protein ChpA (sensor histidine kinase/response regulator)
LAESPRAGATPAITVDDRRPASVVTLDDVMVDDDVPHIEIPELTESVEARGVVKGAPVKVDLPASGDDIVELDFGDGNEEFEPGMELELDLAEDGDDSVLELDVALDMEDESTAADVASAWGAAKPTPPALAAAPVVPVTPVSTANPSPVATASAGGPVLDDDGDPVDEEVLEIFIEEAGEVVATIREYLPRWRTDNVDHQARAEVRRAYHTLKGSGRLVGAKRLGELAWSVENMLNRVIDNTIPASAQMFALVERVTDVMPEMVLAFQERRLPHVDFAILEAAGHALSKGQVPPPWESVVVQEPAATPAVVEAPSAAEASLLIDADDSELDPILMDIFASEARSHLQTLDEFLADARKQPASFTADVLRALHTLKGSAHMAGIKGVAELAGPTEKFVKECHVQGLQADPDISQFLREFGDVILNAIEHVERYARASVPGSVAMLERVLALRHAKLRHAEEAPEPTAARPDKKLITLFLAESSDLIVDAGDVLRHWEENPVPGDLLESLRRELRVLARSAGAAQLTDIVALAMALEEAYDLVADGLLAPGPVFFEVAHRAHERLVDMMDRIAVGQAAGSVDDLVADIQAVMDQSAAVTQRIAGATAGIGAANLASEVTVAVLADVTPVTATPAPAAPESTPPKPLATSVSEPVLEAADDPELVEIFLEEANDLMESTAHLLHDWISSPDDLDKVAALQRDLHTLKGGARMAGMRQIGDLGHHLENLYEGLVEKRFSAEPSLFDILNKCHDRLAEMVESVTAGGTPVAAPELITAIDGWMRGERAAGTKAAPNAAVTPPPAAPVSAASDFVVPPLPAGMAQVVDSGDVDTEILAVFMEEAEELTEAIDNAIHAWEADRERREPLSDLLRHLHTLKGGARLAGLVTLGNLVHDFETLLMRVEAEGLSVDDVLMADVHVRHDVMFAQYERVKAEGVAAVELPTPVVESAVAPATTLAAEPPHASEAPAAIAAPIVVPPAAVAPLQPAASAAPEMPSFAWQDEDDNKPAAPAESIRVPAELVENLVNLAGETSIIRSRIETEISDFNHVIGDIAQTVGRVRELLRRLDIETETQILAIHQQQAAQSKEYEDFDPLEMDRYSGLHHLSRALGESVSDLLDLKDSLSQRARVTETLLVQQSRINSELQEGLMRTRMVPFTRLAPRLRRIVRQVAGELGKKADLDIVGVDGEMDRTVMDRLVAPLEHMLRNSVDHGIEMPEERVAAGKKEQGRVTLHLSREGGEVVLRLSDDGRGIPLEKVKKRAIERGLMRPDAPLSDKEVLQFIFRPGFSTAEKVTQISGRGVGMDVVHSEIKQLNGSIKIHSYPGAGSQFTVRLPFTVSVNRALMVRVGDDAYAIPLNNIEGIVRISPFELEAYYGPDAPEYEYAGSKYRLRYLGGYVHGQATPNLGGLTKPLPVLLVRGTDHAVALQVDSLIGSREVVVKSVGPQLAAVSGLSGATILGDGSVVIILDISAMIRAEQAQLSAIRLAGETVVAAEPVVPQEQDDDGGSTPVVMVVDDSVTVRKVTSRLLERHGYEVVTAKDGVDAISQLQDIQPDIMLLDIEMPRMDGFEVATLVRHDDRLKDTPIIMITSRTGEKHRERAFAIGVNRYMGKPYQETVLLENIRELLKQHMVVHG